MENALFWNRNRGRKAQKEIRSLAEWLGVDERAVQILYNSYLDLDTKRPRRVLQEEAMPSDEDVAFAKAAGVFHDVVEMSHDEIQRRLQQQLKAADRTALASAFVAGVARGRNDLKSPLAAFATWQHTETHKFQPYPNATGRNYCVHCDVCDVETVDRNGLRLTQFRIHGGGGPVQAVPAMVYLEGFHGQPPVEATDAEWGNFRQLLDAIRKLPSTAKTSELVKSSTGLIQGDKWTRVKVLETLGRCGILKPAALPWSADRCFRETLASMDALQLRENREWIRPVSGWCGADGVHEEAVAYWFPGCEGDSTPAAGYVEAVQSQAREKRRKAERKIARSAAPPRKLRSERWPGVGDVFGVPLGNGYYGACRVINHFEDQDPKGFLAGPCFYVASTHWFGKSLPRGDEPLLRKIQVERGKKQIVCVQYPPPRYYPKVGNLRPSAAEKRLRIDHYGSWGMNVDMLRRWRWEHERDAVLAEQEAAPGVVAATEQAHAEKDKRMRRIAKLSFDQYRRRRHFSGWKDRVPAEALADVRAALRETIDAMAALGSDAPKRQRTKPLRDFATRVRELDEHHDFFLYEQETADVTDVIRELGTLVGLAWDQPEVRRATLKVYDRMRTLRDHPGAGSTISVR